MQTVKKQLNTIMVGLYNAFNLSVLNLKETIVNIVDLATSVG